MTERPALESGDRMDREEFERRYTCRPDIKKAELVDGVVYVSGRVRAREGEARAALIGMTGQYRLTRAGIQALAHCSWRAAESTEIQPDVVLRQVAPVVRSSWIDGDGFLCGAPEFCAEIDGGSRPYDLDLKKELYRRLGVREYLVWQTEDGRIDWWELRDGVYVPIAPDESGTLHSRVFPGLALNPAELLAPAGESSAES